MWGSGPCANTKLLFHVCVWKQCLCVSTGLCVPTDNLLTAIDGNIQLLNVSIERINSSLGSGRHANLPAPSCAALPPSSPSGNYWVRASNGSPVRVYCDMTRSCGGVTGGWMKVAELDMTISSQECPSSLR